MNTIKNVLLTLFCILFSASSYSQIDHIHWGTSNSPLEGATITWRSDGTADKIRWGYTNQYLEGEHNGISHSNYSRTLWDYTFPSLTVASTIHYQILDSENSNWTADMTFTTAADPNSFNFTILGDSRSRPEEWGIVSETVASSSFTLFGGDLIQSGDETYQWENWFDYGSGFLANNIVYHCFGNHEKGGESIYENTFTLPQNNPDNSEMYYSFTYGNAVFICLDSENEEDATQYNWLVSTLQANIDKQWKIILFHRPFFTSPSHSGEMDSEFDTWWQAFDDYGVDIIFNGHTHNYQRTVPINRNISTNSGVAKYGSEPGEGRLQIVSGGAGVSTKDAGTGWFIEKSIGEMHYINVDINGGTATIKCIETNQSIFDEIILVKEVDKEAPSSPTSLLANAINDNQIDLTWTASTDNISVSNYLIYDENNQVIATSKTNSYSFTRLQPSTAYSYKIAARDVSGNLSPHSTAVSATTLAGTYPRIYSVSSEPQTAYLADNIIDGRISDESRWSAETYPQSLIIDYGKDTTINTSMLWTHSYRAYQYKIYGSSTINDLINESSAALLVDASLNLDTLQPITKTFNEVSVRYIKIKILSAAIYTGDWISLTEFALAGDGTPPPADDIAPSTPDGLAGTDTTETSISLTWNPSTDNISVSVYYVFANGIRTQTVSTNTATLIDLSPATAYTITVSAQDLAGNESAQSASLTISSKVSADAEAPTTPNNVQASNLGVNSVTLSWDAADDNIDVYGYRIYKDGNLITSILSLSSKIIGLTPATNYNFTVTAYDASGNESGQSTAVAITTLIPIYPLIYAVSSEPQETYLSDNIIDGDTTEETRWSSESYPQWAIIDYGKDTTINTSELWTLYNRAYQFEIYGARNVNDVTNELSSALLLNATNNTDSIQPITKTFTETTVRYVKIKITGAAIYTGDWISLREFSIIEESQTTPDTSPPSIPSSLSANNGSATTMGISWIASSDNEGVIGYKVYVDDVFSETITSGTSTILTGLTANTSYIITVLAFDAATNESVLSSPLSITTNALIDTEAPSNPSNLSFTITDGDVILVWDAATDNVGVSAYNLYKDDVLFREDITGTTVLITGLTAGYHSFTVRAIDATDNSSDNSNSETVHISDITTGITHTNPNIYVYPNPVSTFLNIDLPKSGIISIIDLKGNTILEQNGNLGNNRLPIYHLSAENYLIIIRLNGAIAYYERIVIK